MLQCCSVAVLKKVFPIPKMLLYLYINIEFILTFHIVCFLTATTATPYRSICVYLFDIEYVAMVAENFKIDGLQVRVFDFAAKNH